MRRNSLNSLILAGPMYTVSTGFLGQAPGNAMDTATPLCIFNPAASGIRAWILSFSIGYVSGTPGVGTYWLAFNDTVGQAAPTGTSQTIKNCRIMGGDNSALQAKIGATLPNNPNVQHCVGVSDPTGAGSRILVDYIDGKLAVDPGGILSVQFVGTAGAAPVLCFEFVWVETDITGGLQ